MRRDVDFVVVLGSGLLGGERVPPLLASRLRAGLRIQRKQIERGADAPVLLVSGGQGPDEKLPEAEAMGAGWSRRAPTRRSYGRSRGPVRPPRTCASASG
ncbi:ElyC/SanA/YdcF family protein [Streptomyces sp. CBG31]|uniref:ElyC/SanA/YdcF family protein n=1 Tax=Streptomyces sp. CBG31 TaxID=2762623 RepID=UPI0028F747B9|nr:ElyC/SanA/YdcF family protein [Streptomyces sp. CBG31]